MWCSFSWREGVGTLNLPNFPEGCQSRLGLHACDDEHSGQVAAGGPTRTGPLPSSSLPPLRGHGPTPVLLFETGAAGQSVACVFS